MSSTHEQQTSQRLEVLEKRLLEYERGISKVIETLQKIQDALLGRIELGSPGLLEEIRQLKKGQEELQNLSKNYAALQEEVKAVKEQLTKMRSVRPSLIPKSWQKGIWMFMGGATVIIFIAGKGLDWLISILKVSFVKP